MLCGDTRESAGLISGGSGSSPGFVGVIPSVGSLHCHLYPAVPCLPSPPGGGCTPVMFPEVAWAAQSWAVPAKHEFTATIVQKGNSAPVLNLLAEAKLFFASLSSLSGQPRCHCFACWPFLSFYKLIPSRCCLQFPWSKDFFKCSLPPFIPLLGKRCKQVMAYSTNPLKATRLLFLCSCCPGSVWFGKSNGHQLL